MESPYQNRRRDIVFFWEMAKFSSEELRLHLSW